MVRNIGWDGFYNARDLGGLPMRDGRITRYGALIRSAKPCFVTLPDGARPSRRQPGGVIFHCGAGRDRAGLVTALLLALVDVDPEVIADDYELSTEALPPFFAALGMDDQGPLLERILTEKGTTAREALLAVLNGFDAEEYLLAAGACKDDLAAVRARLVS